MIRAKIIYAILLVILVLFFILYRGELSFQLLLLGVVLPLLTRILLWVQCASVSASLHAPKAPVQKGEPFSWKLRIRNRSWIPGARALVHAEYENKLIGTPQRLRIEIPIAAKNTEQIALTFCAETCGVMRLKVRRIVLFDPLRLWSSSLRLRTEKQVAVLPALPLPPEWEPKPVLTDDDPEYSKEKPGDDPSEIFDFHVYREGDPISRVHWKLSSKHDELMVKEFSLPLPGQAIFIPDYRLCGDFPENAMRLDAMLSLLRAVALITIESGQNPMMLRSPVEPEAIEVESEAALNGWLRALLAATPEHTDAKSRTDSIIAPLADRMESTRNSDRLLLFLTDADRDLLGELSELPAPERLTVFAVAPDAKAREQLTAEQLPFELVTVCMTEMLIRSKRSDDALPNAKGGGVVLP